MLRDVRDEDFGSRIPSSRQHLCQELAGGADERTALRVLVLTGRLANQHHLGVGVALPGNGVPRAFVQRARSAPPDFVGDACQKLDPFVRQFRPHGDRTHALADPSGFHRVRVKTLQELSEAIARTVWQLDHGQAQAPDI